MVFEGIFGNIRKTIAAKVGKGKLKHGAEAAAEGKPTTEQARDAFLKALARAEQRREAGRCLAELDPAVKVFFRDWLSLSYAFSFEELDLELNRKRVPREAAKHFKAALSVLNDADYSPDGAVNRAGLAAAIAEFKLGAKAV